MNSIVKGAMVCASCFVGGVAALIWLVLDVTFKTFRLIRYGYLKMITYVAGLMNMDARNTNTYNKILCYIANEDIEDAIDIKELKLRKE